MSWDYYWAVRDDGLYIWEDNVKIAKIPPDQFVHIMADMAKHLQWQVTDGTTNGNVRSQERVGSTPRTTRYNER